MHAESIFLELRILLRQHLSRSIAGGNEKKKAKLPNLPH